jgi:hypothetical protein
MSRKDYELIAHRIRMGRNDVLIIEPAGDYRHGLLVAYKRMACDLADDLGRENPRFDRKKFLAACGLGD